MLSRRNGRNRFPFAGGPTKFGDYPKAGSLDGIAGFRSDMNTLGLDMPCDDIVKSGADSALGAPLEFEGLSIGKRLGTQPMEGCFAARDCPRPLRGRKERAAAVCKDDRGGRDKPTSVRHGLCLKKRTALILLDFSWLRII
jgi:hypothetical protein